LFGTAAEAYPKGEVESMENDIADKVSEGIQTEDLSGKNHHSSYARIGRSARRAARTLTLGGICGAVYLSCAGRSLPGGKYSVGNNNTLDIESMRLEGKDSNRIVPDSKGMPYFVSFKEGGRGSVDKIEAIVLTFKEEGKIGDYILCFSDRDNKPYCAELGSLLHPENNKGRSEVEPQAK